MKGLCLHDPFFCEQKITIMIIWLTDFYLFVKKCKYFEVPYFFINEWIFFMNSGDCRTNDSLC